MGEIDPLDKIVVFFKQYQEGDKQGLRERGWDSIKSVRAIKEEIREYNVAHSNDLQGYGSSWLFPFKWTDQFPL